MIQLVAKYKNKINWINLDEWSYNSSTFSFQESPVDSLLMLNKKGTATAISNSLLIEKNKRYRISYEVTANVDNVYSGSITFNVGGTGGTYTSTTIGEFSFVTNNTTNINFNIVTTSTSQWAIKNLVVEEIIYTDIELYNNDEDLITLTFQVSDVEDYTSRNGIYSKQVKIPSTKANDTFFRNIFEVNNINTFNINTKCDADLIGDTISFVSGYIQLNDIIVTENKIDYVITFYGENLNLFSDIGDSLLENLVCTDLNHTANFGTISNLWDFPNSPITPAVTYPYIDYGRQGSSGGGKGLIGTAFDLTPSLGLIVSDFYPAISIKYLIDKIFSTYGYTYTSSLFESEWFSKLIIPFCNKEEDLYGWHTATKAQFIGATFSNYNIGNNNEITGEFKDVEIPYYQSGIITSYNPASNHTARYIKPLTEIYRGFNYGLRTKSWSTYTSYKHPTIVSAGANSPINIVNPNSYQVKTNHIPGSYLCESTGNYKFKMTFRNVSNINSTGIFLSEGMSVYLCKVDKNNITVTSSENFKCTDEQIYTLGYYQISEDFSQGYVFHYLDANGDDTSVVNGNSNIILEKEIQCNENELVYFKFVPYKFHAGAAAVWKIDPDQLEVNKYGWGDGVNLTYNQFIPKNIKIKDFLKDLLLMFNLYVDIDKDVYKQLIIEPRETYYSTGNVKDWSSKIDIGSEITYSYPQKYQSYINKLTYKEDNDYHNALYKEKKDTQKIGYGGKRFIVESDFATGESTNSLSVFAPTVLRNCTSKKGYTNKYQVVTSCMWGADITALQLAIEKSTQWQPRILSYEFLAINDNAYPLDADKLKFNLKGTRIAEYPYAGHMSNPFLQTSVDTIDLNFDTKLRAGNIWQLMFNGTPEGTVTKNNLWNKYYFAQFKQLADKNARIMVADFNLTLNDIIDLKLNDTIQVNNTYFLINKISDYKPETNGLTSVELLKSDINLTSDYILPVFEEDTTGGLSFKPIKDKSISINVGGGNTQGNNNITLGNNNTTGNNTFVTGDFNNLADDSVVINSDNTTTSTGSTVINSNNVFIDEQYTNVTVIGSPEAVVTNSDNTYIGGLQIQDGVITNANLIYDGGNIEIDGVYNPYKNFENNMINDCGENGTQITDLHVYIIADGGLV